MSITHVTAHHLFKDGEEKAKLSLRQHELSIDEHKEELLDKLKGSFLSRVNRRHGSFATEGTPSFLAQQLEKFLAEEQSFSDLTVQFMQQLTALADERKVNVNTHFLFFLTELNKQNYFYLFVATQSESLAVSEDLEITPTYAVDTGVSLFGIKIDLTEWKRRPKSAYITIIPPRGKPQLSDIFSELTGFSNDIDKEEATLSFLEGVEAFAKQLPEEKVNDYRTKVVEYCIEREENDEPIHIPSLSRSLQGIDCEKFVREMLPHNPKGEEEVMVDRRSLRRYVKFTGREKDLAISFSSHQLHTRVLYDQENDTLTIKGLPASLRNQLLAHLQS